MVAFEETMEKGGGAAVKMMCRFFMHDDPVHESLYRITERLNNLNIPHAVVGGMCLGAHGFERATTDVDLLVTAESLKALHERLDGLGYLPPFTGSKNLRDTTTSVKIEFLVTGGYPGDGKPKPVSFPDPVTCSRVIDGISYINLETLIELKLASGMSSLTRLKDLGDVIALIQIRKLGEDFAAKLNPYVREKYLELCRAVMNDPNPHEDNSDFA
jgi:hypothetical protein